MMCPHCGRSTARGHTVSLYGEVIYCYEKDKGEEPPASNRKKHSKTYRSFLKERSNNKVDESSTGYKLRNVMDEKGLTMLSLADESGVSFSTIQRMCSGDEIGTLSAWVKVSKAMKMKLSDIIGE